MPFVHGHARVTGWVMAHVRRPTRAQEGQLPLLDVAGRARSAARVQRAVHTVREESAAGDLRRVQVPDDGT